MKTPVSFLMNFMTAIAIAMMLFIIVVIAMAITTPNPYAVYQFPWPAVWQGAILILVTLVLLYGVRQTNLTVAWISWVLLAFFSVLFTFGMGAYIIPVSGLLLILLAIFTVLRRRTTTA